MSTSDQVTPHLLKFKEQSLAFVSQLTIYSRVVRAYPPSHPFIRSAADKVLARLAQLTPHGESFRIGVAASAFSAGGEVLETNQKSVRDYASQLCALGIVSLSFAAALRSEELYLFASLAARPREEVWEGGGISGMVAAAGLTGVEVREIDTSQLSVSPTLPKEEREEGGGLWARLAAHLCDERFPSTPEIFAELLLAVPAQLARNLNELGGRADPGTRREMMRELAGAAWQLFPGGELSEAGRDLFAKMISFVSTLTPHLRRDFLATLLAAEADLETDPFSGVSSATVRALLESILDERGSADALFLKLMHRLSEAGKESAVNAEALRAAQVRGDLDTLFRRSEMERFLPDAYHDALAAILADNALPADFERELDAECRRFAEDTLDDKMVQVIEAVLGNLPTMQLGGGVRRQLADLAIHFLREGDFQSLERLIPLIKASAEGEGDHPGFSEQFVMEVLDSALFVGRERYRQLRELIVAVGEPFVAPLIERLARAESRSLRRFYFDGLTDLGLLVRDAALARLQDPRWYLVRNLIILLRAFPDLEVQRAVRRLVDHPHARVHSEALKSLVRLHSPGAELLLVQELESKDPSRQLVAVQLAELAPTQDVMKRLLSFLAEGGIGAYNLTLKRAVVWTLAAIGDLRALPYLEKLLRSRNLLHPGKHRSLKLEIVRSLGRYPAGAARRLAEEFSAGKRVKLPGASSVGTMDQDWGRP